MKQSVTSRVGTGTLACPVQHGSTGLRHALSLLWSTMREIFDESAYARFLTRTQLTSSREAYAAFRRESEGAKARRPRCC